MNEKITDAKAKIGDINIKVGQPTEVELKNNAGTGYSWYLTHKPDCLWLDDIHYKHHSPDRPGGPFKVVFSFLGAQVDQDYIEFKLARPWEREEVNKVVYAVIVHE